MIPIVLFFLYHNAFFALRYCFFTIICGLYIVAERVRSAPTWGALYRSAGHRSEALRLFHGQLDTEPLAVCQDGSTAGLPAVA